MIKNLIARRQSRKSSQLHINREIHMPKLRKITFTFKTHIEVEIECEAEYTPGCLGSRGSFGEPMEPDTDDQIEILEVKALGEYADSVTIDASTFPTDDVMDDAREALEDLRE